MSQVYFIDGLALGPGYFGFTDPLTNTWRPRKFKAEGTTVNDGTVWSSGIPGNVLSGYPATNGFDGNTSNYVYANNGTTMTWTAPKKITGELIEVYVYAGNTHPIVLVNGQSTGAVVGGTAQQNVWVDVTDLCGGPGGSLQTIQAFGQTIGGVARSSGFAAVRVDGVIVKDSTTTNLDFGTNGFYLPMDGNSPIGEDKSGKGNNWTLSAGFNGTFNDPDVVKDSPSGAVSGGRAQTGITTTSSAPANYATLNPLQRSLNRTPTISDGNLTLSLSSGTSEWTNTGCTMSIGSGKYYWEIIWTSIGSGSVARAGVADSGDYEFNRNTAGSGLPWLGSGTGTSWSCDVRGYVYNGGTETTGYTDAFVVGDAMGILLDLDNNTISYMRNGVSGGVAHSNVTPDFVTPAFSLHGGTTNSFDVNFGQKPFKYAPPQGFLPLNSASATPKTVLTRPDQYVGVITSTGTAGTRTIKTPGGFGPDLVWSKSRSNSYNNALFDTVRGATKRLVSNSINDEDTQANQLKSFTHDGFIYGSDIPNGSGESGVYWCWKAGGNKNTFNKDGVGYASAAAAGLTGGTITPTGSSVGTKQGFSIIKYTGNGNAATIPHGLSQTPTLLIKKFVTASSNWDIWTPNIGADKRLTFTIAATDSTTSYQSVNATTFDVHAGNNDNTVTMIAYLWHDVPGLQKFGKFIGNASADGNFIELGFRPALVWIKPLYSYNGGSSIIAQTGWYIYDNKRGSFNPNGKVLAANADYDEEDNSTDVDFLSNGFKLRNVRAVNTSSGAIYCAWAEAPTLNLYGGQSNAR